jgi:hypothetical protein
MFFCHPQESHAEDVPAASRLPFDVLELVAKHLVARNWHKTCANLASTSKAVQEEIDPILWKRVLYRWDNSIIKSNKKANWRRVFTAERARHIQ